MEELETRNFQFSVILVYFMVEFTLKGWGWEVQIIFMFSKTMSSNSSSPAELGDKNARTLEGKLAKY